MSVSQDSPAPSAGGRKLRRQKPARREPNPEARMPLIEHIRELRNRVVKALVAMLAGAIAGWFIEPPVWKFILGPYCRLPMHYRDTLSPVTGSWPS